MPGPKVLVKTALGSQTMELEALDDGTFRLGRPGLSAVILDREELKLLAAEATVMLCLPELVPVGY